MLTHLWWLLFRTIVSTVVKGSPGELGQAWRSQGQAGPEWLWERQRPCASSLAGGGVWAGGQSLAWPPPVACSLVQHVAGLSAALGWGRVPQPSPRFYPFLWCPWLSLELPAWPPGVACTLNIAQRWGPAKRNSISSSVLQLRKQALKVETTCPRPQLVSGGLGTWVQPGITTSSYLQCQEASGKSTTS